jgi:anaerobic selenocysteine-containing dehydrogenase
VTVETHHTFCRICEALCGLEVTVEDGTVTRIRPDDDHVTTDGFACFKGISQHKLYDSPDRLRWPMKRIGDEWWPISWEQALGEIGEKVRRISGDHGADALAMYVGTAAGFGVLHPVFAQGFMTGLGSRSMFASATQDCANKFAAAREIYGFPFTQPFPDLRETRCLIVVGANPVVSKWSFLQVSNPQKHLRAIEERGGRVFVVDPRRTESARAAGEHVFIRPDTDVFFFLAFLHELLALDAVDHERVARHMTGFDELAGLVGPWTPERAEEVTRIPAATMRELVAAYVEGTRRGGAALYSSTGVNMGSNGSLCFWLQECINAVAGNLDRRGGTIVGRGIVDFIAFGKRTGTLLRDETSRVGGFRSVNDAFPGGILADEILTPGEGQIRGLFVTGGNPLITMANSGRLREAFEQLELLVVTDIYLNETASVGHYALPATSPLQRPDLPFVFPLMLGMQTRPYLQATRAVVAPEAGQRDEASIYLDLARASGIGLFGSNVAQKAMQALAWVNGKLERRPWPEVPQEMLLSVLLLGTGNGTFGRLVRERHGRLRPDHEGDSFLGSRVVTDDGKVHLAPPVLVEATRKLEADHARELAAADRFKLITRRHVKTHNSWTHNHEDVVKGDFTTNHLYVHPDDAVRLGLTEGDLADVTSATATVRVPIRLGDDLMPGVVALPHGWGHQHARGLSVASRTRGVNVNLLAADGPDRIERVSGMAHLTGIVVDVVPAAGPQAPTWSGLEADEARAGGTEDDATAATGAVGTPDPVAGSSVPG